MKYYTVIILLAFVSCTRSIADTNESTKNAENLSSINDTKSTIDVDNLIKKSKITKRIADSISKMSDMAVNRKVDRQVRVMTVLKYKVVELKQSNEVLKVEIDSLTNIGKPYKLLPISYSEDHR
jgi:hypothetical protein